MSRNAKCEQIAEANNAGNNPQIKERVSRNSNNWWHSDFNNYAGMLPNSVLKAMKKRLQTTTVRGVDVTNVANGINSNHTAIESLFKGEIRRYKRHLERKKAKRRKLKEIIEEQQCINQNVHEQCDRKVVESTIENELGQEENVDTITVEAHQQALVAQKNALKAEFLRLAEEHLIEVKEMYEIRIRKLEGNLEAECTDVVVSNWKNVSLDDLITYSERYIVDLKRKECENSYNNRALDHFRQVLRWCLHCTKLSKQYDENLLFEKFEGVEDKLRDKSGRVAESTFCTQRVRDRYIDFVRRSVPQLTSYAICKNVCNLLRSLPVYKYYENVAEPHRLIVKLREHFEGNL